MNLKDMFTFLASILAIGSAVIFVSIGPGVILEIVNKKWLLLPAILFILTLIFGSLAAGLK